MDFKLLKTQARELYGENKKSLQRLLLLQVIINAVTYLSISFAQQRPYLDPRYLFLNFNFITFPLLSLGLANARLNIWRNKKRR